MRTLVVALLVSFGGLTSVMGGQQRAPQSFDIVSVKSNQTGSESRRIATAPGGLFTATNVSLKLLVARGFGVAETQIDGGPDWIDAEKYDVQARANTALEMTRDELMPCLQGLLAERF
jgi:uncharacterized protein (TIGR03435 family)